MPLSGTLDPSFRLVCPFFLARTGSPFAPLADWLAGHHLILTGFCRVSSAHAQFFEAKFNAFILTIKWFQQLQLREKIRYKLGPRYTYFSSLAKKVKKKKMFGCILIHGWHFQMCKNKNVLEEISCYYKVVFLLLFSCERSPSTTL